MKKLVFLNILFAICLSSVAFASLGTSSSVGREFPDHCRGLEGLELVNCVNKHFGWPLVNNDIDGDKLSDLRNQLIAIHDSLNTSQEVKEKIRDEIVKIDEVIRPYAEVETADGTPVVQ